MTKKAWTLRTEDGCEVLREYPSKRKACTAQDTYRNTSTNAKLAASVVYDPRGERLPSYAYTYDA